MTSWMTCSEPSNAGWFNIQREKLSRVLPNAEYSLVYGKEVPFSHASSRALGVSTVANDNPEDFDERRM